MLFAVWLLEMRVLYISNNFENGQTANQVSRIKNSGQKSAHEFLLLFRWNWTRQIKCEFAIESKDFNTETIILNVVERATHGKVTTQHFVQLSRMALSQAHGIRSIIPYVRLHLIPSFLLLCVYTKIQAWKRHTNCK